MNEDLRSLEKWFRINKLKLNKAKTELIIINPQNKANLYNNVHIKVKNTIVQQAEHIKILGVTLTKNLKWDKHINSIIRNCKYQLRSFKRSIKYINEDERKILYNSCIASRLSYGDLIWKESTALMKKRLQVIQNEAARAIKEKKPRESAKPLLKDLRWMNLEKKRQLHAEVMIHKIKKGNAPTSLVEMLNGYKIDRNSETRHGRRFGYTIPQH